MIFFCKKSYFFLFDSILYTDGHISPTSGFSWKYFDCFKQFFIRIQRQTITHLKALIKNFWNQVKNLMWHHSERGQALKTEKALLSLELVWSLSWQIFFQFHYCFLTTRYRAFFLRYITYSYLNWPGNGEPSKFEVQKNCLNYDDLCRKTHLLGALFLVLKLWWLAISRPVEVESPILCCLKVILKLEEYLSCEVPDEF